MTGSTRYALGVNETFEKILILKEGYSININSLNKKESILKLMNMFHSYIKRPPCVRSIL